MGLARLHTHLGTAFMEKLGASREHHSSHPDPAQARLEGSCTGASFAARALQNISFMLYCKYTHIKQKHEEIPTFTTNTYDSELSATNDREQLGGAHTQTKIDIGGRALGAATGNIDYKPRHAKPEEIEPNTSDSKKMPAIRVS